MSVLQQGFREIGRKVRRMALGRRITAADRVRTDALRALGRRAWEARATGPAPQDLVDRIAGTEAKDRELASHLSALEEKRQGLEQQKQAETARFGAMEQDVRQKKQPVDAELAAQRAAAGRIQQESADASRRLEQIARERQSLEAALRQPAGEAGAAPDRAQSEARLAALAEEQRELEAKQVQLSEAASKTSTEIERLEGIVRPLQADLERIDAERRRAIDTVDRARAEVRREADRLRAEGAGVSRERDRHFAELGGVLAAAGIAEPALAAETAVVKAAGEAQSALQQRYDALVAESRALPRGTMLKFSALMMAGVLAAGGATYAATRAASSLRAPRAAAEDCDRRMPSPTRESDRPPVRAHAGGPYSIVRGTTVTLDGSRSRGRCLDYTWTFAPLDCPEGVTGNPGARKKGQKATAVLLCSMNVTLTVTDGNTTDRATVPVTVRAREWKTSITEKQVEAFLTGSGLTYPCGFCQFGRNVCALDGERAFQGEQTSAHVLHRDPDKATWEEEGYKVASGPVKDPDGPFDGWWYVESSNLRIARAALINRDLHRNLDLYKVNKSRGYGDIDLLIEQVREHELTHGRLMTEEMRKIQQQGKDPAKTIEALSDADRAALVEKVEMAIREIETILQEASGEENVKARLRKNSRFNRSGKILLPESGGGAYREWSIANFAEIGD